MSLEPEPHSRSRQPAARQLHATSRWCPGAWNSRSNCAAAFCATARDRGGRTARIPRGCLPAGAGAAARDVGDPLSRSTTTKSAAIYVPVEPAIRSPRPCAPRSRSMPRSSSSSPTRPSVRTCPTPIPTLTPSAYIGLEKYIEAYRVYPQARTEEVTAHAAAHGVEAARRRPAGAACWWWFRSTAGSAARRHGGSAGLRRRGRSIRRCGLLNPHPDCLAEITIEYPYLQDRYEFFRLDRACRVTLPGSTAARADRTAARSRGEVHQEHRRQTGALAAPHDGALHAQPGVTSRGDLMAGVSI